MPDPADTAHQLERSLGMMPRNERSGARIGSPMEDDGAVIPAWFVDEAVSFVERTRMPYLVYRLSSYHTELLADGDDSGGHYQLALAGWEPPTWREYAASHGIALGELQEEHGIEQAQLDQPMDLEAATDLLPASETELGAAYALLDGLDIGAFACPERDVDLGALEFIDGIAPGHDLVVVSATSALALSCLQYVLDERQSGVRVRLEMAGRATSSAGG